jgi:GxxExxY protein
MDRDTTTTAKIIGCAIEVHKRLGAGLLEHVYQIAMAEEFRKNGIQFQREPTIDLKIDGRTLGAYRPDFIVEGTVVVEVKSVVHDHAVFTAQMLTYLRLTGLHVGLILNFNRPLMKDGIKRVVL